MDIQQHWLANFKAVVQAEIDDAGGKAAEGYRRVSARTGLGTDYIYQIYTGRPVSRPKTPSADAMNALGRAYGANKPAGWFNLPPESASSQRINNLNNADDSHRIHINHFDTGGAMGHGLVLQDQPGVIQSMTVTSEWVQKNVPNITSAKNLAIVTGFGDSMKPLYNPGDPLLVDRGVTDVKFEAIYFFRVGDEGFVKRLQRIPGKGILVISDNAAYRDWHITEDMDFEVFARVVKVWRGEDF